MPSHTSTTKRSIGAAARELLTRTAGRPESYVPRHRAPKQLPGVSGRPTDTQATTTA